MAQNVERNDVSIYDNLEYNFDKVKFVEGSPYLADEFNLLQELQEIISQKSTAHFPSGWLSFRPYYTSNSLQNSFYSQDPSGSKPEVALVNGWPIYVTNTETTLKHVNKISLHDNELRSGSRVDGIFLEVWRAAVGPEDSSGDVTKPQNVSQIATLYSIEMYDDNLGWAVGDKGTILKTLDGGVTWTTKESPISVKYKRVRFYNRSIGYAVGEKGYIIKTINGGESWFQLTTPVNDNLNDLSILSQNKVIAVGNNGTILRTIDGSSFTNLQTTSGVTENLNGVHFYDNRVGWIVGDSGTVVLSNDEGATWNLQTAMDSQSNSVISDNLNSVSFFNMDDGLIVGDGGVIYKTADGGYNWVSMTSRVWDGSSYKSLSQLYPNDTNNLNRIETRREFPHNFTLSVYGPSQNYFENVVYRISPDNYPNSIVLEWKGKLDGRSYQEVLTLSDYATAEALANDVNNITSPYLASDASLPDSQRTKTRVFQMTVHFASATSPSDFRPSSGSVPSGSSTEITFSVEDKAWIVGDDGRVLQTNNSGSKWEELSNSYGLDLYDSSFTSNTVGWMSGSSGLILKYNSTLTTSFSSQTTDLPLKTKGRIYPEGNVLAETEDYLEDKIINPDVGVKTSERVQIQYRIRVVDGIDPFNYQESGLGAAYVQSLGPNTSLANAGQYSYENMGTTNGDYGLWRARCRNTYDGYCWAVPMFFVSRRNSSPFSPTTNINGTTNYAQGAVRPDGLTYEQIVDDDIVDIRKKINIHSYTYLLDKNFDKLMGNRLKTKLSVRDELGTQYGTSVLVADNYSGVQEIGNLVTGNITSEVLIVEDTKRLDPNSDTPLSDSDYTLGPVTSSIYMADPAYHTVLSVIDGTVTSKVIPGSFEGLGTDTIKFNIDQYSPADNEQYEIRAKRMDYGQEGLTRVPNTPLGVRYIPDEEDNSLFYRGINANDTSKEIEELTERVSGYKDYTIFYPGVEIGTEQNDINLYKNKSIYTDASTTQKRSLNKFNGQQFKGSLVEYHYFTKTTSNISELSLLKNINGYSVLNVKSVLNAVDGTQYPLSTNFTTKPAIQSAKRNDDNTYDNTKIVINLSSNYFIPSGTIVEIVLEVVSSGTTGDSELGFTVLNKGETQNSYRNPFVSNFNVGSKGVDGLYKSSLYRIEELGGTTKSFDIDLTNPGSDYGDLLNGIVLGLGTYNTSEKSYQSYVWYRPTTSSSSDPYYTLPVSYTENLGTSTVTVTLDPSAPFLDGVVYAPILVKHSTLGDLADDSLAYVFYKYRPYQTVESLPSSLTVEIMSTPDFIYVSNLGTGGSNAVPKDPYENPLEHIPVNDEDLGNDNIFSNVDDLNFINFNIDTGFVKLPALISRKIGEDVVLSSPNNTGDRVGRTYYSNCSQEFRFQAEALLHPVPRKVFIPMLARIRSDTISPFIRGELVMLVYSKVFRARVENEVGIFNDENEEYSPGYFEEADTSIGVYKLFNSPTVRI